MNSDILSGSCYFYPRSPCGERPAIGLILGTAEIFLSTLSLRRATGDWLDTWDSGDISIHALLAESDPELLAWETKNLTPISIHALLAESDDCLEEIEESAFIISIHALLAESDAR